jgi:steroid delta-isomerase-like uncharacterized protein
MRTFLNARASLGAVGLVVVVALAGFPRGAAAQDDNAAIVRSFYDVIFNQRALDRAAEFLAPGYTSHGPAHDRHVDLEATGQFLHETVTVFPDIHIEVLHTVSDGDLVAATWTARGTHSGTMMGLAATGNTVTVFGMSLFRLSEGKIVEGWNSYDRYDLLQQLEPPGAAEAAHNEDPEAQE